MSTSVIQFNQEEVEAIRRMRSKQYFGSDAMKKIEELYKKVFIEMETEKVPSLEFTYLQMIESCNLDGANTVLQAPIPPEYYAKADLLIFGAKEKIKSIDKLMEQVIALVYQAEASITGDPWNLANKIHADVINIGEGLHSASLKVIVALQRSMDNLRKYKEDVANGNALDPLEDSSVGSEADSGGTPGAAVSPTVAPAAGVTVFSSINVGLFGSQGNLLKTLRNKNIYNYREENIYAQDFIDNPLVVKNKRTKDFIKSSQINFNVPVYGYTVSIPELVNLEELYLYGHYEPVINYFSLSGQSVPSKAYLSKVRIPVMHDGGFFTDPGLFSDKNKYQSALSLTVKCFPDSYYLADYTVIDINKIVKIQFLDRRYQIAKIIGVTDYPGVLQASLANQFKDTGLVFNGGLGSFGGVGTLGVYGTLGEELNCENRTKYPYRTLEGGCAGGGFKYGPSGFEILRTLRLKEGSMCDKQAVNAAIIANEVKLLHGKNWFNVAAGAIMNSLFESNLNAEIEGSLVPNAGRAVGLFQLLPGRGELKGFLGNNPNTRVAYEHVVTRKKDLGLTGQVSAEDAKNPNLNAAFAARRFLQISEIANSADVAKATRAIIDKFEIPAKGYCLINEGNGRVDSIKNFFE